MVCETLIVRGPNKGQLATGTSAGYQRHRYACEAACEACLAAHTIKSRALKRKWRAANPDRSREYDRLWVADNPDKHKAKEARFRDNNRDRLRRYKRDRYWTDPDKHRERSRRYSQANREKKNAQLNLWRAANRAHVAALERQRVARKRALTIVQFTGEQLTGRLSMFSGCWMCGGEADTVDHVKPLSKGGPHCLSNLRPACRSCNSRKKDAWPMLEVPCG